MKRKTFALSKINNTDDLNSLSIALNAVEQVTHMKIEKERITFQCIDIEPLEKTIKSINENILIEEVINGKLREYDFEQEREKKHYFMFRNLINEDDIQTLVNIIKDDSLYKDVMYDVSNKVLMLTTSQKDVLKIIQNKMKDINPSIEIWEHKRPIHTAEAFKEKYLKKYARVGCFLVFFALAVVSSKDQNFIYYICWIISALIIGEKVILSAIKNITHLHGLHEDVLVIIGVVMGIVSNHPIESIIALILYMLSEPYRIKILHNSFEKVNEAIEKPEVGLKLSGDKIKTIPLSSFKKDDILIVHPNVTIPLPGIVIKGKSKLNTYPNTSSYEIKEIKENDEVHSGDINLEDIIQIKVTAPYVSGNLAHIIDIASRAPIYHSKAEKFIQKFSYWYTPIVVLIAVIVGIILPIVNFESFHQYIHVSAVLFMLSGSFSTEQSASMGMLAGYAKAFQEGILIESSLGLDLINETQTIIYDTIDNKKVDEEELELLDKLNHLGKLLIVFNDSQKEIVSETYKVYDNPTVDEKLAIMDQLIGDVVYIGDSFKDIECFQKSNVAISRGGISDSRVVENSDIILIDSSLKKVYSTFKIASGIRLRSIVNLIFSFVIKLILIILTFAFIPMPLWSTIIYEGIVAYIVLYNAIHILKEENE